MRPPQQHATAATAAAASGDTARRGSGSGSGGDTDGGGGGGGGGRRGGRSEDSVELFGPSQPLVGGGAQPSSQQPSPQHAAAHRQEQPSSQPLPSPPLAANTFGHHHGPSFTATTSSGGSGGGGATTASGSTDHAWSRLTAAATPQQMLTNIGSGGGGSSTGTGSPQTAVTSVQQAGTGTGVSSTTGSPTPHAQHRLPLLAQQPPSSHQPPSRALPPSTVAATTGATTGNGGTSSPGNQTARSQIGDDAGGVEASVSRGAGSGTSSPRLAGTLSRHSSQGTLVLAAGSGGGGNGGSARKPHNRLPRTSRTAALAAVTANLTMGPGAAQAESTGSPQPRNRGLTTTTASVSVVGTASVAASAAAAGAVAAPPTQPSSLPPLQPRPVRVHPQPLVHETLPVVAVPDSAGPHTGGIVNIQYGSYEPGAAAPPQLRSHSSHSQQHSSAPSSSVSSSSGNAGGNPSQQRMAPNPHTAGYKLASALPDAGRSPPTAFTFPPQPREPSPLPGSGSGPDSATSHPASAPASHGSGSGARDRASSVPTSAIPTNSSTPASAAAAAAAAAALPIVTTQTAQALRIHTNSSPVHHAHPQHAAAVPMALAMAGPTASSSAPTTAQPTLPLLVASNGGASSAPPSSTAADHKHLPHHNYPPRQRAPLQAHAPMMAGTTPTHATTTMTTTTAGTGSSGHRSIARERGGGGAGGNGGSLSLTMPPSPMPGTRPAAHSVVDKPSAPATTAMTVAPRGQPAILATSPSLRQLHALLNGGGDDGGPLCPRDDLLNHASLTFRSALLEHRYQRSRRQHVFRCLRVVWLVWLLYLAVVFADVVGNARAGEGPFERFREAAPAAHALFAVWITAQLVATLVLLPLSVLHTFGNRSVYNWVFKKAPKRIVADPSVPHHHTPPHHTSLGAARARGQSAAAQLQHSQAVARDHGPSGEGLKQRAVARPQTAGPAVSGGHHQSRPSHSAPPAGAAFSLNSGQPIGSPAPAAAATLPAESGRLMAYTSGDRYGGGRGTGRQGGAVSSVEDDPATGGSGGPVSVAPVSAVSQTRGRSQHSLHPPVVSVTSPPSEMAAHAAQSAAVFGAPYSPNTTPVASKTPGQSAPPSPGPVIAAPRPSVTTRTVYPTSHLQWLSDVTAVATTVALLCHVAAMLALDQCGRELFVPSLAMAVLPIGLAMSNARWPLVATLSAVSLLFYPLYAWASQPVTLPCGLHGASGFGSVAVCHATLLVAAYLVMRSARDQFVWSERRAVWRTERARASAEHVRLGLERRADASKRSFFTYIFHEVRVPFNAVMLGIDELLCDHAQLARAQVSTLRIMREQAVTMKRIFDDVTTLTLMEDGKFTLRTTAFSFDELLNGIEWMNQPLSQEKSIKLTYSLGGPAPTNASANAGPNANANAANATSLAPNCGAGANGLPAVSTALPARVLGDLTRLRQVITSLVSNAFEFTPRGGSVHIAVTVDVAATQAAAAAAQAAELANPPLTGAAAAPMPSTMSVTPTAAAVALATRAAALSNFAHAHGRTGPAPTGPAAAAAAGAGSVAVVIAPEGKDAVATGAGVAGAHTVAAGHGGAAGTATADPTSTTTSSTTASLLGSGGLGSGGCRYPVYVRVSVNDTGIGLSDADQTALFADGGAAGGAASGSLYSMGGALAASASHDQNEVKAIGVGLGLSLAKKIVRLHGGAMGVSSTLGRGSQFYFTVPFTVVAAPHGTGFTPSQPAPLQLGAAYPGAGGVVGADPDDDNTGSAELSHSVFSAGGSGGRPGGPTPLVGPTGQPLLAPQAMHRPSTTHAPAIELPPYPSAAPDAASASYSSSQRKAAAAAANAMAIAAGLIPAPVTAGSGPGPAVSGGVADVAAEHHAPQQPKLFAPSAAQLQQRPSLVQQQATASGMLAASTQALAAATASASASSPVAAAGGGAATPGSATPSTTMSPAAGPMAATEASGPGTAVSVLRALPQSKTRSPRKLDPLPTQQLLPLGSAAAATAGGAVPPSAGSSALGASTSTTSTAGAISGATPETTSATAHGSTAFSLDAHGSPLSPTAAAAAAGVGSTSPGAQSSTATAAATSGTDPSGTVGSGVDATLPPVRRLSAVGQLKGISRTSKPSGGAGAGATSARSDSGSSGSGSDSQTNTSRSSLRGSGPLGVALAQASSSSPPRGVAGHATATPSGGAGVGTSLGAALGALAAAAQTGASPSMSAFSLSLATPHPNTSLSAASTPSPQTGLPVTQPSSAFASPAMPYGTFPAAATGAGLPQSTPPLRATAPVASSSASATATATAASLVPPFRSLVPLSTTAGGVTTGVVVLAAPPFTGPALSASTAFASAAAAAPVPATGMTLSAPSALSSSSVNSSPAGTTPTGATTPLLGPSSGGAAPLPGAQPQPPQPQPPQPQPSQSQQPRPWRVLLVEDNTASQKMIGRVLQKLAYGVDVANHGGEALDRFGRGHATAPPLDDPTVPDPGAARTACSAPYDVVLMDVTMPVLNGIEATRELRRRGFWDVPILGLTANALETDRDLLLSAGANFVLTKPVSMQLLASTLQRYIAASQRVQPSVTATATAAASASAAAAMAAADDTPTAAAAAAAMTPTGIASPTHAGSRAGSPLGKHM